MLPIGLLAACGTQPIPPSPVHIQQPAAPAAAPIPQPVQQAGLPPPPRPVPKQETYSVTVFKVPVQSLLFALARDARINIDVHADVRGEVTLNAINQTLPQILSRIGKQVDMRYELDGPNLAVLPDTPYLKNYRIDYVNIARNSRSDVSIATQVASTGAAGVINSAGGGGGGTNNSTTQVSNISNNQFWETLVQNIRDTLAEAERATPEGGAATETGSGAGAATATAAGGASAGRSASRGAVSVIANPETGLIAVRATSRQHERVQEFLDLVMASAKRQVLIEATVVEVQLSDQYQQGINWAGLRRGATGFSLLQQPIGGPLPSGIAPGTSQGLFIGNYVNAGSGVGDISATIQLLESFGKVKVLSSPKISVLNNQTAVLKVVDNRVYFLLTATTSAPQVGVPSVTTYTSELHTVPVGFVMSVTPQIADSGEVTINVRPTISRIIGYVQDPNPALAAAVVPVVSNVPVVQTREMESVLKVSSGQVAVMGGLMQDSINNLKDSLPGVNRLPVLGDALSSRNETATKSELVIFMRPVVVREASLNGDYKEFRSLLPDNQSLNTHPYTEPERRSTDTKAAGS